MREMMGELTYIHIECSTLLHGVLEVTIHRVYAALEELDVKVGPRGIGTSDLLQDRRNERVRERPAYIPGEGVYPRTWVPRALARGRGCRSIRELDAHLCWVGR